MRSRFSYFRFAGLAILAFVCTSFLHAQRTTADVVGTVTDSADKVIAGATVTVTHLGTGATRTVVTNDDGSFRITTLSPGRYDLTAEAPNFSKVVIKDFELNVGSDRTFAVELKPGQITEVVEVTPDAALIQPTQSEIEQGITPKEIENLPLLNRTFAGLSIIAPEARPVGNFDPTKTRIGNFAMNGGDGRQLNVNVDGGDNKDNVVGSLLQNFSYESVQEFQVLQHRWTAEEGRAVGGIVNVITKSGSNDFHGSFFMNFRDESLRAMDFFEKQRLAADPSFVKPQFSRQEFGGSVGGPIIKNKLFFFFALERFRERQNVPASADAAIQIPLIPGSEFVSEIATPYNDLLLSTRVDHKISDRQSMFYRFSYQRNDSPNDQVANPATTDASGGNTNDNTLYSFVVNHTYSFSPNLLNEFTFHFQDFKNELLGITTDPLMTFPGGIQIGANINAPQSTLERKFQFRDDFTWISGDHSFKFGTNYINTDLGGFFFFGAKGYVIDWFHSPTVISSNSNGLYPQGFATPGAVRSIQFSDGEGTHDQKIHQLAFYVQDDWKISPNLTLNLGLRWDANIGNLPDQTNNRTILILQQLNEPRAQAITGDPEKLRRTTPSWTEFQPRIGFAWDPWGEGKTVIRGGYGIFYDQLFQNLTLFSLTQSNPVLYQTALDLRNSAVGVGQLATFRFGIDPLPVPPPGFSFENLAVGGFGRINDPDASEPYTQKFSIGFQHELNSRMSISSDYVHTLGLHESRVQNINPQIRSICDPLYPGSTPASPRCVRGASSRYFDLAYVQAGLPANRTEQINMIGTTNRSLFDSWTTTFKYRSGDVLINASYVLSSARSWGGQPVASYTGNGIATIPERQFNEEEFGPTRFDERHRVVISGVFNLPWDFQLSPIFQFASARPYSATVGFDIDGDGLATNDRLCAGVDPSAVFAVAGNEAAIRALNPRGCTWADVNSLREGLNGVSGRYINMDLRVNKTFRFAERYAIAAYVDLYNLFNTENLSIADRFGNSSAASAGTFLQPRSLYGPGFGPPVGRPFTTQFGFRFTF
jgi:hypothetical protein